MTPNPIIAKVGEPTPIPPRPPRPNMFAVAHYNEPHGWTLAYPSDSRKWVEMMMARHPGSRLVIVPGEAVDAREGGEHGA